MPVLLVRYRRGGRTPGSKDAKNATMRNLQTHYRGEGEEIIATPIDIIPIVGKAYSRVVTGAIRAAKKSIEIVVYDWRWYDSDVSNPVQHFTREILLSAKRGVKVRAICDQQGTVNILKKRGLDIHKIMTKKLVHSKLIIIDDEVVILGSHNFTIGGFLLNLETSIYVAHPAVAVHYKGFFESIWQLRK